MFPIQHKTVFIDGELLTFRSQDLAERLALVDSCLLLHPETTPDYVVVGQGAKRTSESYQARGATLLTEWDLLHSLGLLSDPEWWKADNLPKKPVATIYHPESFVFRHMDDDFTTLPVPSGIAIRYATCLQLGISPMDILSHGIDAIVDISGTSDSIHELAKTYQEAQALGYKHTWTHMSFTESRADLSDTVAAMAEYPEIFSGIEWMSIRIAADMELHALCDVLPNLLFLQFGGKIKVVAPCRHARLKTLVCFPSISTDNFLSMCSFPALQALKIAVLNDAVLEGILNMKPTLNYFGVTSSTANSSEGLADRIDQIMRTFDITQLSICESLSLFVNADWLSRLEAVWVSFLEWNFVNITVMPSLRYLCCSGEVDVLKTWSTNDDSEQGITVLRKSTWLDVLHANQQYYPMHSEMLRDLRQLLVVNQCTGFATNLIEDPGERHLMEQLPVPGLYQH